MGFKFDIEITNLVIKLLCTVVNIWLMRAVRLNHTINERAAKPKQNQLQG